ncbi:lipid II flippase MurJ [Candidatus Chlamydia sanziniae]|uniref:Virulence factor mviN n=1 Tax=Candidatus Chlamydia sanziniae TaxID=1806891 RepID=A0A1A9HUM7_9CHLA|nr:murein biosynthesis integral membrane protein MurJ [Candidatus Chlamydia sanziniae]ANH78535.1 Virulence factor mviN [Candidatus Chlamydia sanziniae]
MNKKDCEGSVIRSIFNILSGTSCSRITGVFREIAMATYFGADPLVAAFWLGFRTIFFLRKILGGPILGQAFIPHFEFLRTQDVNRAAFFFRRFSRFMNNSAMIFTLLIELGLAITFPYVQEKNSDIILLTMILLPCGIFLVMYTVNGALLHCENKFFSVGLAPAIVNVIWILFVIIARNADPRERIVGLAIVLVGGFCFEWLFTVPSVKKFLAHAETTVPKEQDSIKALLAPLSLGILSSGVFQLNLITDICLARYVDEIGPLYLMYSIKIHQLPIHLFGFGIFAVLLPAISRCVQHEDHERGLQLMKFVLNLTISVMVIMTVGLLLLALPGARLLYEHGLFPTSAVHAIVRVLRGYSASIIPMALAPLVSVLFYAQRHYTTPLFIGIGTAVANIFLSLILGCWILKDVSGISYATSITAWIQLYVLWYYSRKRLALYSTLLWKSFKRSGKVMLTTVLACMVTLGLNIVTQTTCVIFLQPLTTPLWPLTSISAQATAFFSESVIFLAFLFGFAKLLRVEDLINLTSFQYWKGQRSFLQSQYLMQDSQN